MRKVTLQLSQESIDWLRSRGVEFTPDELDELDYDWEVDNATDD